MGQPLARAKVYRNVELRQEWFGLEPFDALALRALLWLLMLVNKRGVSWNVLILAAAYVALRMVKRGKPEGHTTTLVRFFARRPFFSAAAADTKLADRPFLTREPNPQGEPR